MALQNAFGNLALDSTASGIAAQLINGPVPVGTAARLVASGTASGIADIINVACGDYRSFNLQLTGSWSGTVTFQVSNDSSNWVNAKVSNAGDLSGAYIATTTANNMFFGQLVGYQYFRARFTTATSGVVNGLGYFSREICPQSSVPSSPTNTVIASTTTSASVLYIVNSAASTNAASIKSTGANLYGISAMNASAATKYVRFYNKTSAPTVGTDTPIMVVAIPATASKEIEYVPALRVGSGLAVAITGGAAALDATAVASGDVQLLVSYA